MRRNVRMIGEMFKTCRRVVGRSDTCVIKSRVMEIIRPHYCIYLSQVMWTLCISTRYFPNNTDLFVAATAELCR